jgi:hypothetical protein
MPTGNTIFRWCMLGAAFIVAGVAAYFLANYVTASIAIRNSGLRAFYQDSVRAMWLAYVLQLALLAVMLFFAALRPESISRSAVIILSLMPIGSTALLFFFASSRLGAVLLGVGAVLGLVGALLWPTRALPDQVPGSPSSTVT